MKEKIDRIISVTLTACAIVVAVAAARIALFPQLRASPNSSQPTFVQTWESAKPLGWFVGGKTDAPVSIMVLADMECPACRGFHATLEDLIAERPNDVEVLYLNYPLDYHPNARRAAQAVHCAGEMNAVSALAASFYEKQDSLGIKSWASFAHDAGIADTSRIMECAESTSNFEKIDASLAFGKEIGLQGTPTVLVDGWMLPAPPSLDELNALVDKSLLQEMP